MPELKFPYSDLAIYRITQFTKLPILYTFYSRHGKTNYTKKIVQEIIDRWRCTKGNLLKRYKYTFKYVLFERTTHACHKEHSCHKDLIDAGNTAQYGSLLEVVKSAGC